MPLKFIALIQIRNEVLRMNHTADIVKTFFKDRQAGIMKLLYFLFQMSKIQIILNTADIQAGFHNLFDSNISEFNNAFQNIFFFFCSIVINGMIKFLETVGSRTLAAKKSFKFFRLIGKYNSKSSEKKVDDFC